MSEQMDSKAEFGIHREYNPDSALTRAPFYQNQPYRSLFDQIDYDDSSHLFPYQGTVASILDDLQVAVLSLDNRQYLPILAFHPPRIIRAAIEYKIANPGFSQAPVLIREAIKFGLNIYRHPEEGYSGLLQFRDRVTELASSGFLDTAVQQPDDLATWHATHPERSQKTAKRLVVRSNRESLLFIALGHGGIAAGLDVFLRYSDLIGDTNSQFYVARFSRYKSNDREPQLSPSEIKYLQDQAIRRKVVVFDEDVASGETSEKALAYFTQVVFQGQTVRMVANINTRDDLKAMGAVLLIDELSKTAADYSLAHDKVSGVTLDLKQFEIIKLPEEHGKCFNGYNDKINYYTYNSFEKISPENYKISENLGLDSDLIYSILLKPQAAAALTSPLKPAAVIPFTDDKLKFQFQDGGQFLAGMAMYPKVIAQAAAFKIDSTPTYEKQLFLGSEPRAGNNIDGSLSQLQAAISALSASELRAASVPTYKKVQDFLLMYADKLSAVGESK